MDELGPEMKTVNIHEAKTRLSFLLAAVVAKASRPGFVAGNRRASCAPPRSWPDRNPVEVHPELAGKILYDPTETADENEWPEENR